MRRARLASRAVAFGSVGLALCGVACGARAPARPQAAPVDLDAESRFIARVAGCAHRSAKWVDATLRSDPLVEGRWPRLLACASAPTCTALAKCAGIDGADSAQRVCDAPLLASPSPLDADSKAASEALAQCRGEGPACGWSVRGAFTRDGDAIQCDGDALVSCVGGRLHHTDCSRLVPGSRCRAAGDANRPRFACLRALECDPEDKSGTVCDGKVAVFCNAGRVVRVDCTAIGFLACFGRGCTLERDRGLGER
ncbi:MAG: hypothetical protein IPG50_31765 [Myxococcales bacterium]|nr:hypothetical protein [Myxococcales bacterium]